MDFRGPLRSAGPQCLPAGWLVGLALALLAPVTRAAAADDPLPPLPETEASEGDPQGQPPDALPPGSDPTGADLDPSPPFPPEAVVAPPPPFPADFTGGGAEGDAVAAPESPAAVAPKRGEPPAMPSGQGPTSPDGTISVLVPPSAPPGLPPGATGGPSEPPWPATGRPAVPFGAPPAAPAQVAPPAFAAPSNQAADLAARGLELPFPLVAGSPTADVTPPRPLSLLEALERSGDRTRRLWITQAYWKLAAAAASVRSAAEAEERLTLVAPGENPDDLVLLDLAIATARGESASAGVDLVTAQQEIIDLVRLPVTDPPPWPVDRPLTAAYQTHFDTIFAGRPATGRVRAIHRQLPLEYAGLVARAEAVRAAERRFATMEALHAKGSKPIGAVLAAHDAIVEQHGAFVRAVRAYNLDIAEYVMAVADLSVPDERFATMLIGQPTPWRQPLAAVAPLAGTDRVVPVAGQAFAPSQSSLSPDVFPAGTPVLQSPPTVGPPGVNPLAPSRFGPPSNTPALPTLPVANPPFGG